MCIKNSTVYLAPLEGLADAPMRRVLCAHGGYDLCYSEFIRVTDLKVVKKTFIREVPELLNDGKTLDGTPIRVQLLGDNPKTLAASARTAYDLGAKSIDLNFGCPSRFVHHSGAMLLKEPELLTSIVLAVRDALPDDCLLSCKVRLGFLDASESFDIIKAVAQEGVKEICVHARTRKGLYRQEALNWEAIRPLHEYKGSAVLIANGNINSLAEALLCEKVTLCHNFMCGRGGFATPNLGHCIKEGAPPYSYAKLLQTCREVLLTFMDTPRSDKIVMDRTKQFLGYAKMNRNDVQDFFRRFCQSSDPEDGLRLLDAEITRSHNNESL